MFLSVFRFRFRFLFPPPALLPLRRLTWKNITENWKDSILYSDIMILLRMIIDIEEKE